MEKGELNQGYYYTKYTPKVGKPFVEIELRNYLLDLAKVRDADTVEVLAPVPSYEEWQKVLNIDFNNEVLRLENQQLKGYNEYLRNIIIECEPYIENVCTALNMEKFANGGLLYKSNEVLSKIRTVIGEKK